MYIYLDQHTFYLVIVNCRSILDIQRMYTSIQLRLDMAEIHYSLIKLYNQKSSFPLLMDR